MYEAYREIFPELKGRELTDKLLSLALADAGKPGLKILRTEKGKPYVKEPDVFLSVSHSENLFICLIGDRPLGIDLQHGRKMDFEKVADRYFTDEEAAWVKHCGNSAFFRLWTRKEAFSKYTGNGLSDVMAKCPVLDRQDVEFLDFQWEQDLYCSCCIQKDAERSTLQRKQRNEE